MTVLPRSFAPPPAALPRPSTMERALNAPDTPFTRWLVRWRYWFFAGLAVLIVIQFNGQWRIGLDSSIYRGVADSLAAGNGYRFAGRQQTQVYPGLPVMLAGLQKIFGTSLVPPLVLMNAFALATLAGVYQLIKRHYPLWVAVAVTCGVGMNGRFLIQSQEIMTDMPFLCGVVWAMLAWDWLGSAVGARRVVGYAVLMTASLFLAATMRPTFWVLAAAWAIAAAWNAVRHRERRSFIALGVLGVVLAAFVLIDPRARGLGLLQGAYEKQFTSVILPDLAARLWGNAQTLFPREIPEAFFNEAMAGTGVLFSILLLAGAVLVTRRQPLWGLQVLILTVIMLAISDVPRYYLMVLPTLWLGYILAILWLTSRAKPVVRDWALFALFSVANFQNLGGALRLAVEQHSRPFINEYKHGSYLPAIKMAEILKQQLGPDDVIVGPGAQVLSYLSGRQVVNGRLLDFDAQKPSKYAEAVANAKPTYVIGPAIEYDKKDADLYKLLIHGVVVPGRLVDRIGNHPGDLWLAKATVHVPAGDWRQSPRVKVFPLGPPKKVKPTADQIRNKQIKAQRLERAARLERNKLKAKRAERAALLERRARKARRQQQQSGPATQPTSLLWPPPSDFASSRPPFILPLIRTKIATDGARMNTDENANLISYRCPSVSHRWQFPDFVPVPTGPSSLQG